MPLEPFLVKKFWAGAKKIGTGWAIFAGASAAFPGFLLLPVVVLVGALVGDGALLAASIIMKRHAAKKKAETERKLKEETEREPERRRQAERDRIASLPPPPTTAELLAAHREKLQATLAMLDGAGLSEIELQAARKRAHQLYLRGIDGLMK